MRNDEHVSAGMRAHNFHQHRERPRGHREPAFAAHGRESVRILIPRRRLMGKLLLDFLPRLLLPASVRNFAKPIARLDWELMRRSENARRLDRAPKRRRIDRSDPVVRQSLSEPPDLLATRI